MYMYEKAKQSNLKHRPIGIGVQGLANTFAFMRKYSNNNNLYALDKIKKTVSCAGHKQ